MSEVQIAIIDQEDTQITLAVPGVQGPSGAISSGGSANQVFYKVSGTNYDAGWTFIGNANVDAAAAIAGTKISPNFGSQAIVTTGTNTAASFIPTSSSIPSNGIYLPGANQVGVATNGTGQLFVDGFGRVGIGAISSGARFEVRGGSGPYMYIVDSGANGGAFVAEATNSIVNIGSTYLGTAAVPLALVVGGSEKARIRSDGTFEVKGAGTAGVSPGFSVNPSTPANSFVIDSSGRLGIGTSSPSVRLQVQDSIAGGSDNTIATLHNFSDTGGDTRYAGLNFRIGSDNGTSAIRAFRTNTATNYETNLSFWTNPTGSTQTPLRAMTIDSSQRVGIGFTSVEAALHAGGNSASPVILAGATTTDVSYKFRQSRGTIVSPSDTGGEGIRLSFEKYNGSGSAFASPIAEIYAAGGGSGSDGYLEFLTKPSGGSATPRARIDSSGRLLVGTSTARAVGVTGPIEAPLQIETPSSLICGLTLIQNRTDGFGPNLRFGKTGGATVGSVTTVSYGHELGTIQFCGADGTDLTSVGALIRAQVDGTPGNDDMPGRLVFATTADGGSSPTERMRIDSVGDIGINTIGTTYGGANFKLAVSSSNYLFAMNTTASGADMINFYTTSGFAGKISTSTTSTAYGTSSDYRLKKNVTSVTDGIARLQQLKPIRFNFIADPDRTVDGFLAHEIQSIVPEAITGTKDEVDDNGNPIYQSIDQSKLVPLLTAALQEAIAKIETLEQRLTAAGID